MSKFQREYTKGIPRSLNACTSTSSTANELWTWANRLYILGAVVLALIIVIGVIFSIYLAVAAKRFRVFLNALVPVSGYAILEYVVYNFFVLLINALASIVNDTAIAANAALFSAAKAENSANAAVTDGAVGSGSSGAANYTSQTNNIQGWRCRSCGNDNLQRTVYCSKCGAHK